MKKYSPLLITLSILAAGLFQAHAGTIFYMPIPAMQSDANSGISNQNQYTSAVDGGNSRGQDRVINGITLYALAASGESSTADNASLNALAGNLSNAGGASATIQADGVLRDVLLDMTFNNGATDGSQQEIVLDPESLEEGATYDLRVYIGNAAGQNRLVNLAFVGDGQPAVETGFFNEDDATTSAGGFTDRNQVYYINYRFTWDGDSTPGITVTQRAGSAPFVLYALTNQVVPGGQVAAGAPPPIVAPPPQGLTTGMVSQEPDQVGVESDDFYTDESLNKYGRWITIEKYGRCWVPTNCPPGWRPYVNGSWKYSDDEGWIFVSDEPWAWACYHYGRWVQVDYECGWAWVPGTVWSGGWVSWREGRDTGPARERCDCVGWAPLPPEVPVDWNVGVSTWVDNTYDIGPDAFVFVNLVDFAVDTFLGANVIFGFDQTLNIFNNTVNITNINYTNITNITNVNVNVNVFNGGPDERVLDRRIRENGGKGIDKIHVDHMADGKDGKHSKLQGDHLATHTPKVKGDAKHKPETKDHLGKDKVDHGWNKVKDPNSKKAIKDQMAHDSKGKNPKNTKAQLPGDLAGKGGKDHKGGQGMTQDGKGQHPGKGNKGAGAGQSLTSGGQGGTGFDQHPGGKKGKQGKGQGQGAGAGVAGTSGFDQHPGGKKGKQGKGQGQGLNAGAGTGAAGTQAAGGGGKKGLHPGKSLKGQGGQAGTGAGGLTQGGGQHQGKKGKQGQGTQGANIQGGTGQAGGQGTTAGGGKKGKNKQGGQGAVTQGGQGAQGTGGQGTTSGGKKGKNKQGGQGAVTQGGQGGQGTTAGGGSKGKHKQGGQGATTQGAQGAGGQGTTSGGGKKGKHSQGAMTQGAQGSAGASRAAGQGGHKQKQQSQQIKQPTGGGGGGGGGGRKQQQQHQVQQQPKGAGGGGGGGGGGKKAKPTPVPR